MNGTLDALDRGLHALAGFGGARAFDTRTALGTLRVYETRSQGPLPTLVLLHGLAAGSAAQYVPFLLAGRGAFRRIVVPDLPGHGASPPLPEMNTPALYAAVVAALDTVLDEPPIVYGNSLGGAVAVHYGLVRPTRGLFLTSPAGTPLPEPLLRALLERLLITDATAAAVLLSRLHARPPVWARFVAGDVRARFSQPHIRALVRSVCNEHGFSPEVLRGLVPPTLLVWGAADRVLPEEMLAYWQAHLRATIERPAGIGHVPHLEAPVWTWRRLLRFAGEVTGPRRSAA
jgi:pimeloyl-ACP methyl ester carboxylesterase